MNNVSAAAACFLCAVFAMWLFAACAEAQAVVPAECRQLIVGVAGDWDDSHARLSFWQRESGGEWRKTGQDHPARLGRSGLAWGRGVHPQSLPGPVKREGDGRAPAGVFAIGGAYGYVEDVRRDPTLPYLQVTESDLWVEDVDSPYYNRHIRLPGGRTPQTNWEREAQMRQNDAAHSLKLFIAHNAYPDVVAGAGSAIFFHIWRQDGQRASFGCTVAAEPVIRDLIAWVRPALKPHYVLLPRLEYETHRTAWGLPKLE